MSTADREDPFSGFPPGPFEHGVLRRAAAGLWLAPLGWWAAAAACGLDDALGEALFRWGAWPAWVLLLVAGSYYVHLAARRFKIGLGAFVALITVWGNATAFSWAWCGWEVGLTVALATGALLCFAYTWGMAVARLLGARSRARRAGLVALCSLMPLALLVIPVGAWSAGLGWDVGHPGLLLGGAVSVAAALAIVVAVWRLTRRARSRARAILARDRGGAPEMVR